MYKSTMIFKKGLTLKMQDDFMFENTYMYLPLKK